MGVFYLLTSYPVCCGALKISWRLKYNLTARLFPIPLTLGNLLHVLFTLAKSAIDFLLYWMYHHLTCFVCDGSDFWSERKQMQRCSEVKMQWYSNSNTHSWHFCYHSLNLQVNPNMFAFFLLWNLKQDILLDFREFYNIFYVPVKVEMHSSLEQLSQ